MGSSDIDSLKSRIREISNIAVSMPPEFRQKCFELLMTHLLSGGTSPAPLAPGAPAPLSGSAPPMPMPVPFNLGYTGGPPMTALLSAFVKKIGLTTEQFGRVIGYMHGKVIFFHEPETAKGAQAQIEWAYLLALKNAIVKGSFSVDAEEVRIVCQEKGIFDRRNFYTNFRHYADSFRNPPEPAGRPQPLSSRGIVALGALIRELADGPRPSPVP